MSMHQHWPSDGDSDVQSNLPRVTAEEEEIESAALSNEEKLLAFADLYGRKATVEQTTDQHLDAFDREVSRLPPEQKSTLHRGYTVKQARLFLSIENNDARRAAKRMARYWDERFKRLGDDAFVDEHPSHRTLEDFRRFYEMALNVPMDPEVDEETRRWAKMYANEWNRGHLQLMEEELAMIPEHEKSAFMDARKVRPDMAASDEHMLLFLRCEDFDATRASRRLVKYWSLKFDLFGREDAFKSFTADALMRDHPREVSLGFFWYLRGTDAFGRGLILLVPGRITPDQGLTEKGLLKVVWYMCHAVLEKDNVESIVLLHDERHTNFSYDISNVVKRNSTLSFKMKELVNDTVPLKVKASHIFAPQVPSFFSILLPFIKWLIGKTVRMRLWVHTGTQEETLSDLQECGISTDLIPTTLGGNMDVDCSGRAWLQERKEAGL